MPRYQIEKNDHTLVEVEADRMEYNNQRSMHTMYDADGNLVASFIGAFSVLPIETT